jgi:16S rRNA (guanine966-N2)-methyltransferase
VDVSGVAIKAIRTNLGELGVDAEVVRQPAAAFLASARAAGRQYDLVFLDPPYRLASTVGPELEGVLSAVLAPAARVVAESDRRGPLALDLPLLTERRYGDTLIRIYGSR